ncbi:effector binding domain-containing protein [bacterium]|nr:effector binding domain-containing protein [candidate division CSSED10-310 bacterium]
MRQYINDILNACIYVEENLRNSFTLETLAFQASYSTFHFHRLFSALVGESPGLYIRKRRLSEAARELAETSRRIIDIAMDYQFNSQEAFSRAFRSFAGIAPAAFRRYPDRSTFFYKKPLTHEMLLHLTGGISMKPKIIEKESTKLIGVVYYGDNSNAEIKDLWCKYWNQVEKLQKPDDPTAYGLCFYNEDLKETGNFFYLMAVAVDSLDNIPVTMVGKTLPKQKYAVFTHKGSVDTLRKTYEFIYGTWLPKSGLKATCGYDFEYYEVGRFKGAEHPESELDIYIPIQ